MNQFPFDTFSVFSKKNKIKSSIFYNRIIGIKNVCHRRSYKFLPWFFEESLQPTNKGLHFLPRYELIKHHQRNPEWPSSIERSLQQLCYKYQNVINSSYLKLTLKRKKPQDLAKFNNIELELEELEKKALQNIVFIFFCNCLFIINFFFF